MIFSKRLQKGRNREVECLDMVYDKVQSTAALALLLEIPNALLQKSLSFSYIFPIIKTASVVDNSRQTGLRKWQADNLDQFQIIKLDVQ